MNPRRLAADIGTAASILVVILAAIPYVLGSPTAVGEYYEVGILGPQYFGIAAAVTAIVFRAARRDRTDPATAAGATLAFGMVAALLAITWAISPDSTVVGGVYTADWFDYHRWVLALTTLAIPICAGIYANIVLD